MLPRVVQQPDDVVVVEGVVRHAAGTTHADESRRPEEAKLVRDSRFGQLHEFGEVADASLAVAEGVDQTNPGGVA